MLICEMLQSVLDYDPLHDINREVAIKEGRGLRRFRGQNRQSRKVRC